MNKQLSVTVGGERVTAQLIRSNSKTVWVQLADGNVILRHKVNHNVQEVS